MNAIATTKPAAAKKATAAKKTTAKTTKPAAKPEAAQIPAFDAESVRKTFIASLEKRMIDAPLSKTLVSDCEWFKKDSAYACAVIAKAHEVGFDVESIATRCAITDKKASGFIGMKVITKIRQLLSACYSGIARDCDGYTYAILVNMIEQGRALDVHDMMRCVSKKVVQNNMLRDNLPVQALKNSSANTADTQTSSTRQMLGELQVLKVSKGKKGDAPEWAETKQAAHVRALFFAHVNG